MSVNCSKCTSEYKTKNGIVKGRQRYKCKVCNYRYTVECKYGIADDIKERAVKLHKEGASLRKIGELVGVSNVAVWKWKN